MIDQFIQITSPFGIKPIKSIIAAPFSATTIELIVPDTNATALYINDIVKTVDASDSNGNEFGIEYCTRATAADPIRGIVVDFKVIHEYENSVYRSASTRRIVRVCQDPFLLCQARINAVILSTDVNRFIDIDTGLGNTSTGISSIQLDYATINDHGGQFRITKILDIVNTTDNKYTVVECVIQKHEFLEGVVSSGDLFDRIGTTIVPHNAGDDLAMGTGDISGTDGNFTGDVNVDGKLTVDGMIDPTAILLTPQAVDPGVVAGGFYYDSVAGQFLFKDASGFNKLTYTGTTTVTVGGIAAGTTLTNDPVISTLDKILRPYILPSFTAFAITGVSTLEAGQEITGSKNFTWTISDPTHAVPNSINIDDITNVISLVTGHSLASPASVNFSGYPGGGLKYNIPASNIWRVLATNTDVPAASFFKLYTANWYWLLHYGTSTNTSLTETQIKALASSLLTPTTARTYSFAAGGYKYICANEDLPLLTTFKDSSTMLDVPFEAAVTVSVTNAYSIVSNYKVYRSTNIMGAAISIIAS